MKQIDRLWQRFAQVTAARIGLGRSGDALPTQHLLGFQYAHARARDAVAAHMDDAAMADRLLPLPSLSVHSKAADRLTYLRRPDLGRLLSVDSAARLPAGPFDAVCMIADGLSANAVHAHAMPLLQELLARLPGWRFGPVILAQQGRVALGDDLGERMHAGMTVVLIGERPGLSVPESLGIYLTFAPRVGRRDADRNCISNVHTHGLSYSAAAEKLAWLMEQARSLRLTGVGLKEDAPRLERQPAVTLGQRDDVI